ncbi:hypothetical protein Y032_0043g810 [Ancylostoma ceylanicum]|uniref:Uncharacterized protein n=1 Tax=Ancylostoma ceylanicum TaxID=53326 RepID=A0A016UFD0_9BILA|nr:hypothetical protein Y032_0043g810 [Ancylostoma ceylanicum]
MARRDSAMRAETQSRPWSTPVMRYSTNGRQGFRRKTLEFACAGSEFSELRGKEGSRMELRVTDFGKSVLAAWPESD